MLKQVAKSLLVDFKSQFIDVISKEPYEQYSVSELYHLQMGKTPSRDNVSYWDSKDYKWISIADLSSYGKYTGKTKEFISSKAITDTGIKIVPKNTVIMSFKLTLGKACITSEDIYTNEAIMAFIPKTQKVLLEFLRFYLSNKNWLSEANQVVKGVTLDKEIIGSSIIRVPNITIQETLIRMLELSDKSKFLCLTAQKHIKRRRNRYEYI